MQNTPIFNIDLDKRNWQYFLFVFVLSTLFLPLVFKGPWDDPYSVFVAVVWSYSIWITQFTGHAYIISKLDDTISWVKRPVIRMFAGLSAMVVYASVAFIVVNICMFLVFYQRLPSGSPADWIENSWFAIKISFWVSLGVTTIGFLKAWRKSELEREKLKTEMMTHKYHALKKQMNPHFLFNSLNVLSDLVYEDQDLAVRFIRQMSDLYRYVLSVKNEDLVPLEKELEFVQSFCFLLETRFEQRLQIAIEVEANKQDYLIPMSIQLLIENAVKHNEASSNSPLQITIKRNGDVIIVENNIQPKNQEYVSTGYGLENLKSRYSYLSNKQVEVKQVNNLFKVELPLLKLDKE